MSTNYLTTYIFRVFKILRLFAMLVSFFILPLVACPLLGQVVQKKQLTPSDYHLWGEVSIDRISADEQWISNKISYPSGNDTLFVRNSMNKKMYSFSFGDHSIFTKNNHFVCLAKDTLQIQNLKTGERKTIDGVSRYEYAEHTDLLIIYKNSDQIKKQLILKLPSGKTLKQIEDVGDFSISPNDQHLVYNRITSGRQDLFLMDLKDSMQEKNVLLDSSNNLTNFTWQKEGKSLAFLSRSTDASESTLYYYILETQKLYNLDLKGKPGFADNNSIVFNSLYKFVISDDLRYVFFGVKTQSDHALQTGSKVEIWNANDKWIYPQQVKSGRLETGIKIALWKPLSNICIPITTEDLPKIILTGDQKYAILSNPKQYEPQFESQGARDYYLFNLETLEKNLFLKQHSAKRNTIVPSPGGKYIAYFKQDCWWVYTIGSGIHKNITKAIGVNFMAKHESLSPDILSGSPGWSKEDKEILLYDQYDLWAITPQSGISRRLTHGRESKIEFQIAPIPNIWPLKSLYDGKVINTIDLEKDLYLRAEGDDEKTGFFKWNNKTGETKIVYKDSYIDQLFYGAEKKSLFFREQRFDLSPQVLIKKNAEPVSCLIQSNLQQKKYFWGRSELLEYENSKKEKLKAVLMYPANYDPQKKYPMIVSVYEKQSEELHFYTSPSHVSGTGFNPTVYTTKGYFVLLPDIIHENQNVGNSAVDCAVSAVNKIITLGLVDPLKIGLIGHSFGGYESSFIITQTPLFATAVAGGGITDLKSFYLTVSQNTGKPDMWRFVKEQWRMGKTPFEAPLLYQRSSPMDHAQNITTPLLLWSGKQDEQVDPQQSIAYYLALRRLAKKNIMLLYPHQGHVISDPVQHNDLTQRIEDWFDYYLKGDTSSNWITEGTK